MRKQSAIGVLFMTLALSNARPEGNRKLKMAATSLLAWIETKGGELFGEILLDKSQGNGLDNGINIHNPAVVMDFRRFLQDVSSRVTAFRQQVETDLSSMEESESDQAQGQMSQYREQKDAPPVILPARVDPKDLDFSDILDILGDYTKSFVETVQPLMVSAVRQKEKVVDDLLEGILSQITQTSALKRGDKRQGFKSP